jgi:hypothetical protein
MACFQSLPPTFYHGPCAFHGEIGAFNGDKCFALPNEQKEYMYDITPTVVVPVPPLGVVIVDSLSENFILMGRVNSNEAKYLVP